MLEIKLSLTKSYVSLPPLMFWKFFMEIDCKEGCILMPRYLEDLTTGIWGGSVDGFKDELRDISRDLDQLIFYPGRELNWAKTSKMWAIAEEALLTYTSISSANKDREWCVLQKVLGSIRGCCLVLWARGSRERENRRIERGQPPEPSRDEDWGRLGLL